MVGSCGGGRSWEKFSKFEVILWIVCLTCFVQNSAIIREKCLNCILFERGLSLPQFLLLLPFISVYNLS